MLINDPLPFPERLRSDFPQSIADLVFRLYSDQKQIFIIGRSGLYEICHPWPDSAAVSCRLIPDDFCDF